MAKFRINTVNEYDFKGCHRCRTEKSSSAHRNDCKVYPGLTKPGKVGDFFALVSMKSPNFCQKAKF
jgi:hypothetical protein